MREKQPHQAIESQEDEQKTPVWKRAGAIAMTALTLGGLIGLEQNREGIAEHLRQQSDEQTLENVNPDRAHSVTVEAGDTFSELVEEQMNSDTDGDGETDIDDRNDGIRPYSVKEARIVSQEKYGTDINTLQPGDRVALYEDAPDELE